MHTTKHLAILWLLLAISFQAFSQTADDPPPLPADLVFTSSYEVEDTERATRRIYTLVLLNSETSSFVTLDGLQDNRSMRPISWSPQGDKIAIMRYLGGRDAVLNVEICVITVSDISEICMSESTEYHYLQGFDITWSDDGQRLYFAVQNQNTLRLIEANAITGETLHIIYETDYRRAEWDQGLTVSWTHDLSHVAIGTNPYNSPSGILVDLNTYQEIDVAEALRPYIEQVSGEDHPYFDYICEGFSPNGTYFTGVIVSRIANIDSHESIIIFDTDGNIIRVVDFQEHSISCPSWSSDESRLYIHAYSRTPSFSEWPLLIYSIKDDEFVRYSETEIYLDVVTNFSPSETHIAFSGMNDPYGRAIYVLYPDGTIHKFCEPEHSCSWPVWRPTGS